MSESDGVLVVELAGLVIYLCTFGKLGAMIARKKNAATRGAFVGMAFGPIGLLIAGFLDERPSCPKCKTRVDPSATICSGCRCPLTDYSHEAIEDEDDHSAIVEFSCHRCQSVMKRPSDDIGKKVVCDDCGELIKVKGNRLRACSDCSREISRRAVSCPHCGCPVA